MSRNVRVKDDDRFGGSLWIKNGVRVTGEGGDPIQVAGSVTVDETSFFGGNWDIESDLEVAGVLAPGNLIGTVKVGGDHTFVSGATYRVEIDADGNSDLLEVGGAAHLDGTVEVDGARTVQDVKLGHVYTIVDAKGGLDGTRFDGVDGVEWIVELPFLAAALSYSTTKAFLTIGRSGTPFNAAARTKNQTVVADAVDSLGFGASVHDAIAVSTETAQARTAFDLLSGEIHASMRAGLLEGGREVRSVLVDRLRLDTPRGLWMDVIGATSDTDATSNAAAVKRNAGGFMIGGGDTVGDDWRVGGAVGYTSSRLSAAQRLSSGKAKTLHLAAYGATTLGEAIGLRLGAAHSWHDVDTDRTAVVGNLSETLKADYNARTSQVFGEIGYPLPVAAIDAEPFLGLAYVNHRSDDFRERGGGAALDGSSSSDNIGVSTLGLRGGKSFPVSDGSSLTLEAMVAAGVANADDIGRLRLLAVAEPQELDVG